MHPPDTADPSAYDPIHFAASSRAGPVSDECIAVTSTKHPHEPSILQQGSKDRDPQAVRQQEAAEFSSTGHNQDTTETAVPGLDEIPELASMKAAPEIRQALGSPATQAEYRAELGDSPAAVRRSANAEDVNNRNRPEATNEEVTQSGPRLSPNVADHTVADEMNGPASPASSSADAPGSEYDDFEDPDLMPHSAELPEPQVERSSTPSPETQRVAELMANQSVNPELTQPREGPSFHQPNVVAIDFGAPQTEDQEQAAMMIEKLEQSFVLDDQQESVAAENPEEQQPEAPAMEGDEQVPSATETVEGERPAVPEAEDREEREVAQLLAAGVEAEEEKVESVQQEQRVDENVQDEEVQHGQPTEAISDPLTAEATVVKLLAPAVPTASQDNAVRTPEQDDGASQINSSEDGSLRVLAPVGETEAPSAPTQGGEDTDTQVADGEDSESLAMHETESAPVGDQLIAPSTALNDLVRPAEEEAGASPKRQRLSDEDAQASVQAGHAEVEAMSADESAEDQAATAETQPTQASKAKPAAKKAAAKPKATTKPKPPPKPKAPPKPKEPKAKAKKVPEQPPAAAPAAEEQQIVMSPAQQMSAVPDQGVAADEEAADTKPKKARKAPARPRKKAANVASLPEEDPATPPPPQQSAQVLDPNLVDAGVPISAEQTSAPGTAPAELAQKAKGKAAAKPRAPKKAKTTAKLAAEPPLPVGSHTPTPIDTPTATEPAPKRKPAAKRTAAKKVKGPIAKLLPAQADDAVSELELEPTQQPITASATHANQNDQRERAIVPNEEMAPPSLQASYGNPPSEQGDSSMTEEQQSFYRPPPSLTGESGNTGEYQSSNIFTSMPPPLYPAQAYYPTRAQLVQQQNRGLSSLSNAASMLDSEMHWSESSVARPGSASSEYEGINEPTSPTTMTNTAGSVAGDAASDTTSLSQDPSLSMIELDPRIYPPGWQLPYFDLIDPDQLMTTMRERTVWTFWDCYLPLGCRDQDMVLHSNDGVAFPCAAWNPCLFSKLLKRIISNPSRGIRQIMQRGAEENRKILGYNPLPCVVIDENWHATNLLLSFLHPIPNMFLPDVATCRVVLDVGMKYGVDRAINMATQRLNQLDEEDRAKKGKGKVRSTEEEIAADLAERAAEAASRR